MSMKLLRERPVVGFSLGIGFFDRGLSVHKLNFLPLFVQGVQGLLFSYVGQVVMGMVMGTCLGSLLTAITLNHLGFRNNSFIRICDPNRRS